MKLHPTSIRRNETSPGAGVKSLGYLDSILATRDALAAGCDDALFLNGKGHLACTAIGNLVVLMRDQLVTPPLSDGIVPGITRAVVLRVCDGLGLEPIERSVTSADLDKADAMISTNSLRLVAPVSAVGRRALNSSASRRVQAIIADLAASIREETGVDPRRVAEG